MQLDVHLTTEKTIIKQANLKLELTIYQAFQPTTPIKHQLYLSYQDHQIVYLTADPTQLTLKSNEIVIGLNYAWPFEAAYLLPAFINYAQQQDVKLVLKDQPKLPDHFSKPTSDALEPVCLILERFGYPITKPLKAKPAKARHRYQKDLATTPFFIETRQAKAEIYWDKRDAFIIKAGATMMPEIPLNKDGSVGFAAKMGSKLRQENSHAFQDFQTTEDIILKSVNEIGLFLYFGGINSWLALKNKAGQSLDELTRV